MAQFLCPNLFESDFKDESEYPQASTSPLLRWCESQSLEEKEKKRKKKAGGEGGEKIMHIFAGL